jgi:allene oxide cyclase
MRKELIAALAAALATAGAGGGAALAAPGVSTSRTLRLVERATTDTTVDVAPKGDSTGDLLTFHNGLYDRRNQRRVGRDVGQCVRVQPGRSYDCAWTAILRGGQITVQGPFYDTRDSVLAITGGTGLYRRARGDMRLHARPGGASYDFVYRVTDVGG